LNALQANSNLVISNKRGRGRGGRGGGDDGTAKSLNAADLRMGDLVRPSAKPSDANKSKKPKKSTDIDLNVLTGGNQGFNVDTAPAMYRPKTKETRAAYEALLAEIKSVLTDAPHDVLCGAADEILLVLKDDGMRDPDRQRDIGKMLGDAVDNNKYTKFVAIGKLIDDFSIEEEEDVGGDGMDEELGVAVEFEDEEDEDEDNMIQTEVVDDELHDDGDDGDEDGLDPDGEGVGDGAIGDRDDPMSEDDDGGGEGGANAGSGVPKAREIDGFWLQRRISEAYDDSGEALEASQAQKLAEEVFDVLKMADVREIENKLVMLMDFERFELVKELMTHKDRIVWCMRLARAADDAEKEAIETEMAATKRGTAVLNELKGTRTSARDRYGSMRIDDGGGSRFDWE
jgi:pre-mRNA-splicing helicase BRR2